jgi:hypothetical protein
MIFLYAIHLTHYFSTFSCLEVSVLACLFFTKYVCDTLTASQLDSSFSEAPPSNKLSCKSIFTHPLRFHLATSNLLTVCAAIPPIKAITVPRGNQTLLTNSGG